MRGEEGGDVLAVRSGRQAGFAAQGAPASFDPAPRMAAAAGGQGSGQHAGQVGEAAAAVARQSSETRFVLASCQTVASKSSPARACRSVKVSPHQGRRDGQPMDAVGQVKQGMGQGKNILDGLPSPRGSGCRRPESGGPAPAAQGGHQAIQVAAARTRTAMSASRPLAAGGPDQGEEGFRFQTVAVAARFAHEGCRLTRNPPRPAGSRGRGA